MATGVVLLHGKWDAPPHAHAPLQSALEARGVAVSAPELPWSLRGRYGADFDSAVQQVVLAVHRLRADGCTRVLLCGHSLGATAALAALPRSPADGAALLAPGHYPARLYAEGVTREAVQAARAAVAAGQGAATAPRVDVSEGRARRIRIPAEIYLSYYDPQAPAQLARHAEHCRQPVLWVDCAADAADAPWRDAAFRALPAGLAQRHTLAASHRDTPRAALPLFLHWLQQLRP